MSAGTALAAVTGPLLGLLVVVVAYCLGIFLSIKCCRSELDGSINAPNGHPEMLHSGSSSVDIFIVSRSDEYLVNPSHRPTAINRPVVNNQDSMFVSLAPAYEEPPTYEECIRNGLA